MAFSLLEAPPRLVRAGASRFAIIYSARGFFDFQYVKDPDHIFYCSVSSFAPQAITQEFLKSIYIKEYQRFHRTQSLPFSLLLGD